MCVCACVSVTDREADKVGFKHRRNKRGREERRVARQVKCSLLISTHRQAQALSFSTLVTSSIIGKDTNTGDALPTHDVRSVM